MDKNKFRKGVGAIVLDEDGSLLSFQRADFRGSWQMPEGGMDGEETAEEAIYREINEEIGLAKGDYVILGKTEDFIRYLFVGNGGIPGFVGQEKQFFLIKLKVSADKIRYDSTSEKLEFDSCKKTTPEEFLSEVPFFKKDMYEKVLRELKIK